MKNKYIILLAMTLQTVVGFAQKNQIKSAEKELASGNSKDAITILLAVEYMIYNAIDEEKAQFYFIKGNALLDLANKKMETGKNLSLSAKAFQELIAVETASGKIKYSTQAVVSIKEIKRKLVSNAVADSKSKNYKESAEKIYDAYLLDKKDTINLYYAASAYVSAKDFGAALKLYEELKKINYSGKAAGFYAYNKETKEEDLFDSSNERDIMVKAGTHDKPRNEAPVSKRGEIYKNIALIYVQDGKTDKAKKAISDARRKNPEDTSLSLTEANLYLETKDFEIYEKLVAAILEKNPNDVDLIFNLAVINANAKKIIEAETYYKKVITLDPKYLKAYMNLTVLKLEEEKILIDSMNKLGTTAKEMKQYEELKKKRNAVFKSVIPYLEKAVELDPKDEDVTKSLLSVYNALEMTTEYKALKARI